MVATVQIVQKNGAGGSPTVVSGSTFTFKNADNPDNDHNNRMIVPNVGADYSFEKWFALKVTAAPDIDIADIRFYSTGVNPYGTGVTCWAKTENAFATPAEATTEADYADAFSFTAAAPLTVGAGPYSGTGEKGDYVVMMLKVTDTAGQGVLPGAVFTFAWDET